MKYTNIEDQLAKLEVLLLLGLEHVQDASHLGHVRCRLVVE
jgi:hypothetical protein